MAANKGTSLRSPENQKHIRVSAKRRSKVQFMLWSLQKSSIYGKPAFPELRGNVEDN